MYIYAYPPFPRPNAALSTPSQVGCLTTQNAKIVKSVQTAFSSCSSSIWPQEKMNESDWQVHGFDNSYSAEHHKLARNFLYETIDWVNERRIRAILESYYHEVMWLGDILSTLHVLIGDGLDRKPEDILRTCSNLFSKPVPPPAYITGKHAEYWEKRQLRLVLERQLYWKDRRRRIVEQDFQRAKKQGYWD